MLANITAYSFEYIGYILLKTDHKVLLNLVNV